MPSTSGTTVKPDPVSSARLRVGTPSVPTLLLAT